MKKIVIITQARTGSSRLPGKVLLKAAGKTFLQIHAERLMKITTPHQFIIATTTKENDIKIVEEASRLGIAYSRGSEQDVLERYYQAAKSAGADIVVRVTSDCPFADPVVVDSMLRFFLDHQYDYVSNTFEYTYPDGLDTEIMTFAALEKAYLEAVLPSEREHVTPFIRTHADLLGGTIFKAHNFINPEKPEGITRLTLDEPQDLEVFTQLIEALGPELPWQAYHEYLIKHPGLNEVNSFISSNKGYAKSIKQDDTNK